MDKETFEGMIKRQIIQITIETENPMAGSPFEGMGYIKILGDVVDDFKNKLVKNELALNLIGDSFEIKNLLTDMHISIQNELLNK